MLTFIIICILVAFFWRPILAGMGMLLAAAAVLGTMLFLFLSIFS
jgi:hypothetical protein